MFVFGPCDFVFADSPIYLLTFQLIFEAIFVLKPFDCLVNIIITTTSSKTENIATSISYFPKSNFDSICSCLLVCYFIFCHSFYNIEYVWSLSMYGHWVCMVIEYVWSLSMYGH